MFGVNISMKLAYVTNYNARDINKWSGLAYHISQCLKNKATSVEYIGPLKEKLILRALRKYKRQYYNTFFGKKYLGDTDIMLLQDWAKQVSRKLSHVNTDIIFSITTNPIAYLETKQPMVFWGDATFAGVLDYYPHYSNLCQESIQQGHQMERLALEKCQLAIYASEWAAKTAIEHYQADPAKVKVVPFGANIQNDKSLETIKDLIKTRPTTQCKLLFLGVDWFRKGGDIAFEVTKTLNKSGLPTELTVVGCQPIIDEPLPNYIKPLGFINKSTVEGREKLNQLLAESHFLILPSKAECFGVVFSEASSFGVPSLATDSGGIPTAVRTGINGKLFSLDTNISEYCEYISGLFTNYSEYEKLAISAFHEYQSRLNWSVSGNTVKTLLKDL
jgi:glycosyltransferase involved in cell wall biosynthesis